MRIEASAPGKLVLLGEYAVLEGAPALVLAVDRRAHATLTLATGDAWEIHSPTLGLDARLRANAVRSSQVPPRLGWVAALLGQLDFVRDLPACRIELDSAPFFIDHSGAPAKLGLGSSAALTVALLGALHALAGRAAPPLDECVRVHRALQHGRGSGIDVAAALGGGLLRYQLESGQAARQDALELPTRLCWCCVYSGHPASTADMLAIVEAFRERDPTCHARCMHELATIASRGADAVARDDSAACLACLHDYAHALARLGEASGADIGSRAHRALGAIARGCGTVYKSCGAGGGDVGIALAVEAAPLHEFAQRAARAGFPVIGMAADPRGLRIDTRA